jgi:acylphosphatase
MNVRKMVVVKGRVQGVAFRNHTQANAMRLNVSGWVKNLPNGDVEGCFEGDEAAVRELVDWCGSGPSAALVENLTVLAATYTGEFNSFEIRY